MVVYCSHCGKKIEEDLDLCPYCGKRIIKETSNETSNEIEVVAEVDNSGINEKKSNKKKQYMYYVLAGIGAFFLVFVLSSLLVNKKNAADKTSNIAIEEANSKASYMKKGEFFNVGNFEMKIIDFMSPVYSWLPCRNGFRNVVVDVSFRNISKDVDRLYKSDFKFVTSDGIEMEPTFIYITSLKGDEIFFQQVNPGIQNRVAFLFECPETMASDKCYLKVNGGTNSRKIIMVPVTY